MNFNDWKKQVLKKDMCSITVLDPRDAQPCPLPPRLIAPARRLRRQLGHCHGHQRRLARHRGLRKLSARRRTARARLPAADATGKTAPVR